MIMQSIYNVLSSILIFVLSMTLGYVATTQKMLSDRMDAQRADAACLLERQANLEAEVKSISKAIPVVNGHRISIVGWDDEKKVWLVPHGWGVKQEGLLRPKFVDED